jgi:hypothetical protein
MVKDHDKESCMICLLLMHIDFDIWYWETAWDSVRKSNRELAVGDWCGTGACAYLIFILTLNDYPINALHIITVFLFLFFCSSRRYSAVGVGTGRASYALSRFILLFGSIESQTVDNSMRGQRQIM